MRRATRCCYHHRRFGFAGRAGTPATTYSAPGDTFAFSFNISSPTESNPSGLITNFGYDLNGVNVASAGDAPVITFYDAAHGELFDLFFQTSGDDVSFDRAQIGRDAGGTDASGDPISITEGNFTFTSTVNFGKTPTGSGTMIVPEPASLTLISAGLSALQLRSRNKTQA